MLTNKTMTPMTTPIFEPTVFSLKRNGFSVKAPTLGHKQNVHDSTSILSRTSAFFCAHGLPDGHAPAMMPGPKKGVPKGPKNN